MGHKRVYFLLQLFGFIKIVSGYIQVKTNKIYIHVSDKKAFLIELIDFDGVKKSFKPLMDYHFIRYEGRIELGSKSQIVTPLGIAFIINYFESILRWAIINRKPYVDIKNKILLYEDEFKCNYCCSTVIILNLLMIVLSFIKIILEKIIYEFRKIGQQNQ